MLYACLALYRIDAGKTEATINPVYVGVYRIRGLLMTLTIQNETISSSNIIITLGSNLLECVTSVLGTRLKFNKNLVQKYLIPLSTCLTQLCSPSSIVTLGDLNPSQDIRLMMARRFAPSPLATASHKCWRPERVTHQKPTNNHPTVCLQQKTCLRVSLKNFKRVPHFFQSGRVKQFSPRRTRSPCLWKLRGRSALSSSVHPSPWLSNSSWRIFSSLFVWVRPLSFISCRGNWNRT